MKKKKIQLQNVTLVAVTSVKVEATIKAMKYSMRGIEFGDVVLITHEKPSNLPKAIRYAHVDILDNIDKYSYVMIYKLHEYIKTEYALIIHYDGFVVNPHMWSDDFFKYDYIGSPWIGEEVDGMLPFYDEDGNICRVGNGVSLRSKRFMEFPSKSGMEWKAYGGWYNEDGFLCIHNKKKFEENGMCFAPVDVAVRFGREYPVPEGIGIEPFLFHKWVGDNKKYPSYNSSYSFLRSLFYKVLRIDI